MLKLFDLSGKVAMVTGCSAGLGQGMAVALAQAGADIVGVNTSAPTATAAAVTALGRRFHTIRANLADIACVQPVVDEACQVFGRLDILVNNAGIIRREDALNFSEKDWDDVINLNLKTVFFLSQAVARRFIAQDSPGKIINIASMLSFQGGIRVPSYTASKSGVVGLTRLLACEWAPKIRVNALAVGATVTEALGMFLNAMPDMQKQMTDLTPMARLGTPEDIALAVLYLASPAGGWITGKVLEVDGGTIASNWPIKMASGL